VYKKYCDENNNILGIRMVTNNVSILLIGVYGPNQNEEKFFRDLKKIIMENSDSYIVSAGDWNLTYSSDPTADNIDIINMNAPPSIFRTELLLKICDEYGLSDPYRFLHFKTRDFTYIPRSGTRNRSRLDFFLVSDNLLHQCNNCIISDSLDTNLFDHKHIKLFFGKTKKTTKHFINPVIFSHPRFKAVVATAVVETYLQHAVRGQEGLDLAAGLQHTSATISLIKQANDLEFEIAFSGGDVMNNYSLANLNSEVNSLVDEYPEPDLLDDIQVTCAPDIFLEVLMGNIRNVLISFQVWIQKIKSAKVCALSKQLIELKKNFAENCDEIFRKEEELCRIKEVELATKVGEIKLFENLHNEKPSPLFLNLIKRKNCDSLSGIRAENGSEFDSAEEREEHIVRHFEKIYVRDKKLSNFNFENCIENFLGPDLLQHPVVQGSKITATERERLDRPLSLLELDNSVKNANKKSAPGIDGYSNKLILACWEFLRRPLLNYANYCFISGKLTHNFRSACIRLIPKKGNLSDINNINMGWVCQFLKLKGQVPILIYRFVHKS
jgi:hypothetical protein